jgi:hypothetical protein
MPQIFADGIDDALRNLRATWPIEKYGGMSTHGLRERRELRSHPIEIERRGFVFGSQHVGS